MLSVRFVSVAAAEEQMSVEDIARSAAAIEKAANDPVAGPPTVLSADEWAHIRATAAGAQSVPAGTPSASGPASASFDGSGGPRRDGARFAILVTLAAPETVRAALGEAAGRRDVVVAFRGLSGGTFRTFTDQLMPMLAGMSPSPAVTIDPPLFRRFDVEAVPVVVDLASGAQVRGTVSIAALLRFGKVERGEPVGPLADIAEEDMAEVMRSRAAALDGPALIERAQAGYWANRRMLDLPAATKDEVREVDPSVYTQADVVTPDGVMLARAGQRVNPLELLPFSLTIIAFDGRDLRQVEIARREATAAVRPVLMATAIERSGGWEGFGRLEDLFQAPVYMLDARLAERLKINAVPAVVTASGSRLRVHTIAVGEAMP